MAQSFAYRGKLSLQGCVRGVTSSETVWARKNSAPLSSQLRPSSSRNHHKLHFRSIKSRFSAVNYRFYSTSDANKATGDETNENDDQTGFTSLAQKYNLDPSREDELKLMEHLASMPVLTEPQKKFIRHRITKKGNISIPPGPMVRQYFSGRKTIVIAGGTGWLALNLRSILENRGHTAISISRNGSDLWPTDTATKKQWFDVTGELGVPDCDAFVQLTGPNFLEKHTVPSQEWEDLHYHSRGGVTELIAHHVKRTKWPPRVFIQASHVGMYPHSETRDYDESYNGLLNMDLVGSVSQHYEKKSELLAELGIRTVQMRFGHVIGDKGFLPNIHRIDDMGKAFWTKIGSGEQWFPWIHINDAMSMIIHAIEHEDVRGVVNAVAPQPIRQKQFAEALSAVLPNKTWKFNMPETVANWNYPKRAHLLTEGRRVIPRVAQEANFHYLYPTIESALESQRHLIIPIDWKNPVNRYVDPKLPFRQEPH